MLALDPVGLVVTALVIGALLPGPRRLLPAVGAVLTGEVCRLLATLLLTGRVAEMTIGGALSRYGSAEVHPVLLGFVAAGLTALSGLLMGRVMRGACAIHAALGVIAILVRW